MKRLPPLNWLRAFEASARYLSFTRAAQELHLTQAAVSKQVKNLEFSLGVELFTRLPRGLELSEDGAAYLPVVRESIERLATATHELFGERRNSVVNLRVSLVFFICRLAPKLQEFYTAHPSIDLRFTSNIWSNDGEIDSGAELEIRYGRGQWPGLDSERLSYDSLIPVCSSQGLKNRPINSVEDLKKHTLLHVMGYQEGWAHWLAATGNFQLNLHKGMQFDTLLSAFQVAQQGMGVALGRSSLIENYIESGVLVAPLSERVAIEEAFYLVTRQTGLQSESARVVHDWLLQHVMHSG